MGRVNLSYLFIPLLVLFLMDSHDEIKFCEGSVNELPMILKKIMLSLNVSDVFFISLLIQNQWHVFILHDGL